MQHLCSILVLGPRQSKLFSRQDLRVRAGGLVREGDILRRGSEFVSWVICADCTQGEMRKIINKNVQNSDTYSGFHFAAISRIHCSSFGK
jgi:hypothetical protein